MSLYCTFCSRDKLHQAATQWLCRCWCTTMMGANPSCGSCKLLSGSDPLWPKTGDWWLSHEDSEFSGDVGAVMVRARDVEMTSPCLDDVPIKPWFRLVNRVFKSLFCLVSHLKTGSKTWPSPAFLGAPKVSCQWLKQCHLQHPGGMVTIRHGWRIVVIRPTFLWMKQKMYPSQNELFLPNCLPTFRWMKHPCIHVAHDIDHRY